QSAYPSFGAGTLCIVGGILGFARTRSVPSVVAGSLVGALYLWSGDSIRKGTPNGLEVALGASAILLLSSIPRFRKGPVPKLLAVTSVTTGAYYANTLYQLRR
ncbi:transmembrane proteins 14C-domain-containing protein, partial [Mycena floridula]